MKVHLGISLRYVLIRNVALELLSHSQTLETREVNRPTRKDRILIFILRGHA